MGKTIVRNEDNVSLYIFEEADRLIVSDTNILSTKFLIEDLNSENSTLYGNLDIPEDWVSGKYKYMDEEWISIEGFKSPDIVWAEYQKELKILGDIERVNESEE